MWWFLAATTVVLGGWCARSARHILYPERRHLDPPQPLPAYTTHRFTTPEGASFDVWRLSGPQPRSTILLLHGFYANRYQLVGLAEGLAARGCEALLMELRGHGARPGPFTCGVRETADAQAVLAWVQGEDPDRPIGVLGFSAGAAIACQVAAQAPEVVRAVVADSIYARFFPLVARAVRRRYHLAPVPWAWLTWQTVQWRLGARLALRDPVHLAPNLRQPLLVIQGGADPVVPLAAQEEVVARWAGPVERWRDPEAGHVRTFARQGEAYCDRVADFLHRTMT